MVEATKKEQARPFTTFNFLVKLTVPGAPAEICDAEFSECSGLEMNMEPKSIREGGSNTRPIHLIGKVSYGQLTLKRGMTKNFDLWSWFEYIQLNRNVRASGEIQFLTSARKDDGEAKGKNAVFKLTGCLPIKIKAPSLNAKDGGIAIEEMQIAYETIYLENSLQ